jgi:hypothetical protein
MRKKATALCVILLIAASPVFAALRDRTPDPREPVFAKILKKIVKRVIGSLDDALGSPKP